MIEEEMLRRKKMRLKSFFSQNICLILIIVIASLFLFLRLGDRNIGCDETWTVIGAENVLNNGYPKITKTYDFFPAPFVLNVESWLSFYLVAGFYYLFGISNFISRLPFALFGLLTVILYYFLVKDITKNRNIAYLATFLLATSSLFLTHARQSRYFSVTMFFTLLLCYSYLKILETEPCRNPVAGNLPRGLNTSDRKLTKGTLHPGNVSKLQQMKSRACCQPNECERISTRLEIGSLKYSILFVISNVLFFYTHVQLWFYIAASLVVHFFVFGNAKKHFKRFLVNTIAVIVFCSPWIYYWGFLNKHLFKARFSLSISSFIFKLAVSFYYYFMFIFSLLFVVLLLLNEEIRHNILHNKRYYFIFTVVICMQFFIAVLGFNPLPELRLIVSGLLPLSILLIAHIIYIISKKSRAIALCLIILVMFTNLLNIIPFYPLKIINPEKFIEYKEEHYSDFIERSIKVNLGLWNNIREIAFDYKPIHETIFEKMNALGLINKKFTVITDLDYCQLNYQSAKQGLLMRYEAFPQHISELNSSVYLVNYKDNQKMVEDYLDKSFRIDYIDDNMDTMWIDCPDPIYRRYARDEKSKILIAYPIELGNDIPTKKQVFV